jgi:hypothetical protein
MHVVVIPFLVLETMIPSSECSWLLLVLGGFLIPAENCWASLELWAQKDIKLCLVDRGLRFLGEERACHPDLRVRGPL